MIGDARIAIEIKSVEEVLPRPLKGLNSFAEDYPNARLIIVSLDPFNRRIGNVECIHILDFLASAALAMVRADAAAAVSHSIHIIIYNSTFSSHRFLSLNFTLVKY